MATTKYTLTSSWQLVATSAQDFIAENASSYDAHVTFAASTPAENAAYHTLDASEGITRLGVVGNLYARDPSDDLGVSVLIVSTS